MKTILVKSLDEGRNQVAFDIATERFDAYVKEADVLYQADGEPLNVSLEIDRYDDSLFVRGTLTGSMGFECARCLAYNDKTLELGVKWTLLPRTVLNEEPVEVDEDDGVELDADDLDVSFYSGQEIDLESMVREELILELEANPRCELDSCEADEYLAALSSDEAGEDEDSDRIDPRWAKLAALKEKMSKD